MTAAADRYAVVDHPALAPCAVGFPWDVTPRPVVSPSLYGTWVCSGRGVTGRASACPESAYWSWFWLCLANR